MAIPNFNFESGTSSKIEDIRKQTKEILTAEEKSKKEIDKNEKMFLNLLATQLKNQTPDNPTDTKDMMQHFFQIHQLKSGLQLNAKIEEMKQAVIQSGNITNASAMVGKNAIHEGNSFAVNEKGNAVPLYYKPENDMRGVKLEIVISNGKGESVYKKDLSNYQIGAINSFSWNGKDLNGNFVEKGKYNFAIRSQKNQNLQAKSFTSTLVTQAMTDGSLWLENGEKLISNQVFGVSSSNSKNHYGDLYKNISSKSQAEQMTGDYSKFENIINDSINHQKLEKNLQLNNIQNGSFVDKLT